MKNFENLIGMWPNLSRAYEVALLGKFTIKVIFDKEYTEGFDDYKKIKSFYKNVIFSAHGDLTVEITKPDYFNNRGSETLDDIIQRVETAKNNPIPNIIKNDSSFYSLLKTATDKLQFSIDRIEKVLQIAKIIGQLTGSKFVEIQHLAEAIHYNSHDDSTFCVAEDESVCFGHGIKINLTELSYTDVEAAIDYLKTRIYDKSI